MSWIALKMLVGDRAKFFGIVLGLTFAALLITQQGSIFCGLMLRTAGQVTDITGADLWIMDHSVRYIDDVKPMLESNLYRVRGVEGVLWAVPLYRGNARVKVNPVVRKAEDPVTIEQVIVDFTRFAKLYPDENWKELDAAVAAKAAAGLSKLESKRQGEREFYSRFVNRELEMNDHRAIIVGICEATRTFQSNPVVYTTYSRAKLYAPQERKILSYILAKTERGLTPDSVAERISRETGLGARTSDQFTELT